MKSLNFKVLAAALILGACSSHTPGPDKQFGYMISDAALGAGTGAAMGFQFGAATGPGAAVGAGFGAVAGAVKGMIQDLEEESLARTAVRTRHEREVAYAQEVLIDHYKRRLELHPTRDIYPADLFFMGDEATLKPEAREIVRQIAALNKKRLPWSRLMIASYAKVRGEKSSYAERLTDKRARAIGDLFVSTGIEPRRIEAKGLAVDAPVLIDPSDDPERYSQAIEFIPLDR